MRLIFVCLLAAFFLSACKEDEDVSTENIVRPVRTMEIVDTNKFNDRFFVGTARAAREVSLAFRVPGTIVGFEVQVGDIVTKGEAIANLDPAPFQAEVDRLSADLESAKASFTNAKLQTDRQRTLVEKDVAAQATLDRFIEGESSAAAAIKSVQGALDRATLELGYTQLKAPFDGRIVAKYVENFEAVQAQVAVLRMLDASNIEMVIDVPERYISLVHFVDDITVTFDALENVVLPATISEIGSEASTITRTYPVTLLMQQPVNGAQVMPGMAGRAHGQPRKGYDPLGTKTIPAASIFVPEGQSDTYVWIFDTKTETVSPRSVTLGAPRSLGISVKDGLNVGDIIVTAGVNSLRDGQKVSLLSEPSDGGQ